MKQHRDDRDAGGRGRAERAAVRGVVCGVGAVHAAGEGVLGHGVELAIEGDLQRQEIDEQESKCMDRI